MKYPFPEQIETGKDVVVFFAEYFEDKFGYQLPKKEWPKTAGFVNYLKNKGYTPEDIALIVWGKINSCDKVKSVWYCKYDIDKLGHYRNIKQRIDNQKENEVKYEDIYENENQNEEGDYFSEYL
ncbi:MAG: hypothetical protein ACLFUH_05620 [Bacteroidales bacterium]